MIVLSSRLLSCALMVEKLLRTRTIGLGIMQNDNQRISVDSADGESFSILSKRQSLSLVKTRIYVVTEPAVILRGHLFFLRHFRGLCFVFLDIYS